MDALTLKSTLYLNTSINGAKQNNKRWVPKRWVLVQTTELTRIDIHPEVIYNTYEYCMLHLWCGYTQFLPFCHFYFSFWDNFACVSNLALPIYKLLCGLRYSIAIPTFLHNNIGVATYIGLYYLLFLMRNRIWNISIQFRDNWCKPNMPTYRLIILYRSQNKI